MLNKWTRQFYNMFIPKWYRLNNNVQNIRVRTKILKAITIYLMVLY